jgi:hypothetical protein
MPVPLHYEQKFESTWEDLYSFGTFFLIDTIGTRISLSEFLYLKIFGCSKIYGFKILLFYKSVANSDLGLDVTDVGYFYLYEGYYCAIF